MQTVLHTLLLFLFKLFVINSLSHQQVQQREKLLLQSTMSGYPTIKLCLISAVVVLFNVPLKTFFLINNTTVFSHYKNGISDSKFFFPTTAKTVSQAFNDPIS